MKIQPSEPVIAESYPTFWDDMTSSPISQIDSSEDAYTTFVNLTDDDFPAEAPSDSD